MSLVQIEPARYLGFLRVKCVKREILRPGGFSPRGFRACFERDRPCYLGERSDAFRWIQPLSSFPAASSKGFTVNACAVTPGFFLERKSRNRGGDSYTSAPFRSSGRKALHSVIHGRMLGGRAGRCESYNYALTAQLPCPSDVNNRFNVLWRGWLMQSSTLVLMSSIFVDLGSFGS